MIVVSDASPLTSLAQIGRLHLLQGLFSQVIVPQAVADELLFGERNRSHPAFLATTEWIQIRLIADPQAVTSLLQQLDLGEAESIVLAEELRVPLLLMDEKAGREVARKRGLRTTGLLGVLISAKERLLIDRLGPVLNDLIHTAGFWVSDDLYREVLSRAGEGPEG